MQLFDTELNMSPVDIKQIPKEEKDVQGNKETKTEKEVSGGEGEYTIIDDVLDKTKEEEEETDELGESKKEIEDKTASEQSADSSKFPYSTFAKALYEEGVITDFDEETFKKLSEESGGGVEALIASVQETITNQIDAYKQSLSKEGQEFLDAIESGVPLDKFISSKTQEYSYLNIKEDALAEDDDLCKKLISDDLKARGFDADEIKDQIDDIDNLGKLEPKAKIALKKLQAVHKEEIAKAKIVAEKQQKEAIENNKRQLAAVKAEIEKVTEIIPGTKLNSKLKAEIYDLMTTPAEQLPNGQWINAIYAKRAKDPVSWDMKVAYLDKLGVFDGKWDKIISGSKSAAVKDLSKKLESGNISATGEPNIPESTPTAKDILKSMEKTFHQTK